MSDTNLQMYPLVDPETGKHFYPQTHAKAVILSDGSSVEDHIDGHGRFAIATLSGNGYVLDIDFTFNEGKRIAVKFTAAPTVTEPYIVIGGTNYPIKKKNGNAAKITAGSYESLICGTNSFILLGEGGEYGTAKPTDVLAGKTLGTENGVVEGTIPIITGDSIETTKYNVESNYVYLGITPDAYYSGVNWVRKSEPNLIAANIKAGASIFGVSGNSNVVDTSAGTATAGQMLIGSKAYVDGALVTGTMTNNGSVTKTLGAGESFDIPAGYHDGTGKVTASTLSGQTGGTATAAQILEDETAWVGGVKLTGTMPNNGAVSATLSANGTYTIPAGYHDGTGKVTQSLTTKAAATITPGTTNQTISSGVYLSGVQTIKGDANLVSANIKAGVSIFGVSGNSNVVDTSAGTATAAQMLSGSKAYVDGALVTGTMTNRGAVSQTLNAGGSYTIPAGYHDGTGKVTANSLSSQTAGTAAAAEILKGKTAWVGGTKLTGTMPDLSTTSTIDFSSTNTNPVIEGDAAYVQQNTDSTTRCLIRYAGMASDGSGTGTDIGTGRIGTGTFIGVPQATMATAAGLTAAKLAKGQTVLGVAGTYTSDATAAAGNILVDKTAYVNGTKVTGTMANNGAVAPAALNAGGSYTIPAGYHNGSGKVTTNSLASQTSATATAAQILKDKTAWVGGTKLTGTMVNNGAVSATLAANGTYTIPAGYHNGSGTVTQSLTTKAATTITPGTTDQSVAAGTYLSGALTVSGDADLTAANVKYNVGIFGVTGTYTSDGTLAANKMLSGVIGYSKGTKYTGSIASQAAKSITPGTSNQTVSSGVYLSGNITVLGSSNLVASNIKSGVNIFGVTGTYTDDATASNSRILSGYTAYKAGTKLTGTMPNLTSSTDIDFQTTNSTPVIEGDTAFWTTNSDGVVRCCIRWPGPNGYIEGNTLFGIPQETMAAAVGLTADKLAKGNTVMGVTGTLEVNEMKTYTKTFTKPKEDALLSTGMDVDTIPRLYSVRMVIDGSTIYTIYVPGLDIINNSNGIYLELLPSVFLYVGDDAGNGNVGKISFNVSSFSRSTIVVTFYYF